MLDFVFVSNIPDDPNHRLAIYYAKDETTHYLNPSELYGNMKYSCEFAGFFKRLVHAQPETSILWSPAVDVIITQFEDFNRLDY